MNTDAPHNPRPGVARRTFVKTAVGAAAGAAVMAPMTPAHATGRGSDLRSLPKIDVHAHFLPDDYRQALLDNGHAQPDGFPVLPRWNPTDHLAMMDRLNIGTAMLSITSPGALFGEDPVEWARRLNDSGAQTVRDHPGRFGLFATLPLPNVDAALVETAYAFDTLHADGVVMETNFDGIYLGDPTFDPVFAELNRRQAVLFIHPTSPACHEATSLGYPRPVLEFLFDTTRAVADMVLNGTLAKYPDIRVIVPHAGSALPVIADRIAGFAGLFPLGGQQPGAIDVIGTLQRLYYEVGAGSPFPRQIEALLDLVDADQMLFGTDFPFGGLAGIEANTEALLTTKLMKHPQKQGVLRTNALQLFPHLASARTQP